MATFSASTTFATSRVFAEPPEVVFAAFADPERLARWWGPDGFSNTFEVFDFRPGGLWRLIMHGPDGTDYPNETMFVTIEPARKIMIEHLSEPHFHLTVEFVANGSGTLVSWVQVFENPEIAVSIRHIVEPANEQNLNRWQTEIKSDSRS